MNPPYYPLAIPMTYEQFKDLSRVINEDESLGKRKIKAVYHKETNLFAIKVGEKIILDYGDQRELSERDLREVEMVFNTTKRSLEKKLLVGGEWEE